MTSVALLALLWILGGIIALLLFFAPLGIWFTVDKLLDETRRTNRLLKEVIDGFTHEDNPEKPLRKNLPTPLPPALERPRRPIYEIKHP